MENSNTTLVKVKFRMLDQAQNDKSNSNTTLVKVKFEYISPLAQAQKNSNTTLVKVKLSVKVYGGQITDAFKYNTC